MRFSIITCTYNSEKYLQQNIDSVENQVFKDYEHVFIDGFSSDSTMKIIEKYKKKYPDRVHVYQFEPQGISDAMNKGVEKSSGDFINYMHSDDSFYDEKIFEDINALIKNNKGVEMIYGKTKVCNTKNGESVIWPSRKIYERLAFWKLLFINYVPHQSVFVKKSVFDKYGNFDVKLKSIMDYDFWLRITKDDDICARYFDRIISNFMIRIDSQSTVDKFNTEQIIVHKKYLNNTALIYILFWIDRMHRIYLYKFRKSTRI